MRFSLLFFFYLAIELFNSLIVKYYFGEKPLVKVFSRWKLKLFCEDSFYFFLYLVVLEKIS